MQKRIYAVNSNSDVKQSFIEMLVCALLTVGIGGVLCAFTNSGVICSLFVTILAVVMSVVITIIRKKPPAAHIFHAAMVILFAVLAILCFNGIQNSMLYSVNVILEHINNVYSRDISLLGTDPVSTGMLMVFLGIAVSIVSMIVSFLVNKRAVVLLTVFTMVILFAAVILKASGMLFILPLMFLGWIGCWSLCSSGSGKGTVFVCIGTAVLLAVGVMVMLLTGFEGFSALNDLHKDTADKIYDMRFGSDTLPHGDLTAANEMLEGGEVVMAVTFENPESMYLKGFTGSSFAENKWKPYAEGTYIGEWNGMLRYFEKNGFDPQKMYSYYRKLDGDTEKNQITIENINADRRFVYLPFNADSADGAKNYRDLYAYSNKLFGAKKYTFTSVIPNTNPELLNPSSWVNGSSNEEKSSYVELENAYRAFVHDTYLDIDDNTREEINEVFFNGFDARSEDTGVYAITSRIRSILKIVTNYTESPAVPDDKDFIGWFLGNYRKGNSAYYATTAVMAYRTAGIPARYAEGYYVSDADVSNMNATQKNRIQLTAKNAHAWVEIYREGIGWINVDVTPGFYVEDTSMSEIIDISGDIGEIGGLNGRGSEHYTNALSRYSPEKVTPDPNRLSSGMRMLLILIWMILIFIMALYIRYVFLAYRKYDRIYGQTKAETTNYMLSYICDALNADGINAVPDNPNAFRSKLLTRHKDFVAPEFDRVISLIRRSSYGGAKLREHELRTIRIFIEKLNADVYKGKSIFKKLIMKYIKII